MVDTKIGYPLQWFLSFINADLENLTTGECLKFVFEVANTLNIPVDRKTFERPFSNALIPQLYSADIAEWKGLQMKFREILSGLAARIETIESMRERLLTDDTELPEILTLAYYKVPALLIEFNLVMKLSLKPGLERPGLRMSPAESIHLDVTAKGESMEDGMTYYFLQALNGVAVSSLKRCLECNGWFVQTSKRDRIYCSSRCATKNANRARYLAMKETSPEGLEEEREKGRTRAKKSYENKKLRTNNSFNAK